MADEPMIEIPLLDCPIGLLTGDPERDHRYQSSQAKIMAVFSQVTADSYWRLTVAEHQEMLVVAGGR